MTFNYPATIIIRHERENKKKCSLTGLEGRLDFEFYSYPRCKLAKDLTGYVVLAVDGEPLSEKDAQAGIILIDGTWKLAEKMVANIPIIQGLPKRSIPKEFVTAYPRRQEVAAGLASIEAIYVAYLACKRPTDGLLDHYYWKEDFLLINQVSIQSLK
ncbi:MAG: DTW domain-containing protein [Verrucomicrobia bacterium]|nr:DTW domain-containing protein [Verrucomicrobiota bacterium]MBS0638022.1 DTW domain-containing protein [Verrucomicrobiota bacterium]